ncbi:MAG: ChrR family anti-sigma-E factor [Myxococcota bacterium]
MTEPRHHLTDELLLGYAAGALDEALSLFVATHLTLCARCRAQAAWLEAVGGSMLEDVNLDGRDEASANVTETARGLDEALARLDREAPPSSVVPALPPRALGPRDDPMLAQIPEPLRRYVPLDDNNKIVWSTRLPGVGQVTLPLEHRGYRVAINYLRGGLQVPRHTHDGMEYNLVLTGGFSDRGLNFERGDAAIAGAELTHALDIHPGAPCMLLSVMEHPLVPASPLAKLLSRILPI